MSQDANLLTSLRTNREQHSCQCDMLRGRRSEVKPERRRDTGALQLKTSLYVSSKQTFWLHKAHTHTCYYTRFVSYVFLPRINQWWDVCTGRCGGESRGAHGWVITGCSLNVKSNLLLWWPMLPHIKKGEGSSPLGAIQGPFCVEFACSPWVSSHSEIGEPATQWPGNLSRVYLKSPATPPKPPLRGKW